MKYHLAMRKKETLSLMTAWMDLEGLMLSEIDKSDRERQTLGTI